MPLLYIAQAATANGIDLVSAGSQLGIQFSATSYRASLNMPIKQFTSSLVLLSGKKFISQGSKAYSPNSLYLTTSPSYLSLGSKQYTSSSTFISVTPAVPTPYPSKVYPAGDLFITGNGYASGSGKQLKGYTPTVTVVMTGATQPTGNASSMLKGYAPTIITMTAPKSFTLPMTMYA